MQCPVCNVQLVMSDRQGVEIDYCPKCRGVWLDRGELDKIIERSTGGAMPMQSRPMPQYDDNQYRKDDHHDDHHGNKYSQHYPDQKKKKRESFLGDIFDF